MGMNPAVYEEQKARVVALNEQIAAARKAYYVDARPVMSDLRFDALERELKSTIKTFPELAEFAPELKKVGSDLSGGKRIKHYRPMLSIENHYTVEDFLGWYDMQALDGNNVVAVEPKFDGISVSLFYENGTLIRALTRGDGESGEEITDAIYHTDIPVSLTASAPKFLEVRGELVMRNSTLEKINAKLVAAGQKPYANTRNLTAGTMKQKDLSNIREREITIAPWDVIEYESKKLPAQRVMRLLYIERKEGFPANLSIVCQNRNQVAAALNKILAENKGRDITCDGVVMKIDDSEVCAALGNGSNYTNFQICFKPQSASNTTFLRRVVWQIGRTGKLTPVGECDPVVLAGAEVRRAALCNMTYIREKNLTLGAKIEMLRSGDVIPQIVKVVEPGNVAICAPTCCPECGKMLEILDETGIETHWCTNAECPGRIRDLFHFIGDRDILELDGLGPEMATRLADGYARNVGELFTFANEARRGLEKYGEDKFVAYMRKKGFNSTILQFLETTEKAKTASWDRWIAALGIPLVSKSLGKLIAKEMKLTAEAMKDLPTLLRTFASRDIAGMGQRKKDLILDWVSETRNVRLCQELYLAGVRPAPLASAAAAAAGVGQPLAGIAFCVTGEMIEMDRDKLSVLLESLGATKKSGVSKKCTHLIRLDAPGRTKVDAAEKLGIPIVDKQWVIEQLAKGGIKLEDQTNKFPLEGAE